MKSHKFWLRGASRIVYGEERRITNWGLGEVFFAKLKWYRIKPKTKMYDKHVEKMRLLQIVRETEKRWSDALRTNVWTDILKPKDLDNEDD